MGLVSCTHFQYVTVSSSQRQNDKREFVHENDSIKVVYNFQGFHGPVRLSIYNKLDVPIFINWRMSSLIIDGQSKSFYDNKSHFEGSASTTDIDWTQGISSEWTNFSGSISKKDEVSFVPPKRFITAAPTTLKSDFFERPTKPKPARKSIAIIEGSGSGKSFLYESVNSPFQYESYITYSTDPNFTTRANITDNFWVSEILETAHSPNAIINIENKSDTFYNAKSTGVFLGLISLIGLLALAASAAK